MLGWLFQSRTLGRNFRSSVIVRTTASASDHAQSALPSSASAKMLLPDLATTMISAFAPGSMVLIALAAATQAGLTLFSFVITSSRHGSVVDGDAHVPGRSRSG